MCFIIYSETNARRNNLLWLLDKVTLFFGHINGMRDGVSKDNSMVPTLCHGDPYSVAKINGAITTDIMVLIIPEDGWFDDDDDIDYIIKRVVRINVS